MTNNNKKGNDNVLKKWLLTLGLFIAVQLLLLIIDGTIFEPKLNKIGHYISDVIGEKLHWFTLYHHPFLKIVTLIFGLYMIAMTIKMVVHFIPRK